MVMMITNDATGIYSRHGRPPFTLPAALPVTRIFPHYPTPTLPDVKKPSQPAKEAQQAGRTQEAGGPVDQGDSGGLGDTGGPGGLHWTN